MLSIGELARRAGVTASALRYYEQLGLLPAPARISGQRRYPESAARLVGVILLYRDAGFTLAGQKALMATRDGTPGDRSQHAMPQLQRRHHRPAGRPATVRIPPAVARPTVPRNARQLLGLWLPGSGRPPSCDHGRRVVLPWCPCPGHG